MKMIREWAHDMPKECRTIVLEELRSRIHYGSVSEEILSTREPTMKDALATVIAFTKSNQDAKELGALLRRYMAEPTELFHVCYWTDLRRSSGVTLEALDISHAVDVACHKGMISERDVIYVSRQESKPTNS
jgi:hypothetical protein